MGKNMQKVQDMLDGNYKEKIQVGYSSQNEKREIGDKWVDSDGNHWEQKDGYRTKNTSDIVHHSWDKKCSGCEKLIVKPWDRDTFKADGRCYHCQLNFELDLKFDKPIKWFAYRRLKDLINMEAIEKDMEQWVDAITEERKQNPFDMKVANALANGEVNMSISKNKLS
tara:strand:+ start:42 stop:545 length:504 start_codon:yes stop_codon:yes gene_type:complete